jgi:hypothetical protein
MNDYIGVKKKQQVIRQMVIMVELKKHLHYLMT